MNEIAKLDDRGLKSFKARGNRFVASGVFQQKEDFLVMQTLASYFSIALDIGINSSLLLNPRQD